MAFIPFKPGLPAITVKLKMNQPAKTVLELIAERRHATAMRNRYGKTLLVALSNDSKPKRHL